jgi:hypothetical protein
MWRSPAAHSVRDGEVAGSNPVIPTVKQRPREWPVSFNKELESYFKLPYNE